jgi:hypothetical protein
MARRVARRIALMVNQAVTAPSTQRKLTAEAVAQTQPEAAQQTELHDPAPAVRLQEWRASLA